MILLAVAVVGGIVVGLAVAGIHEVVAFLQTLLFTRPIDGEGLEGVPAWRLVAVPVVGTLVLGLLLVVLQRAKRLGVTDPVEANALKAAACRRARARRWSASRSSRSPSAARSASRRR